MATRKQQRRKYQRAVAHARAHDVEIAEGGEERRGKPDRKQQARPARGTPLAPSAKRTAKRALLFATFFYLVITFTSGNVSPTIKIANTVVMFVLFWSMGWMVENFVWRRHQTKQGGPAA
jgi:hypothetical protein